MVKEDEQGRVTFSYLQEILSYSPDNGQWRCKKAYSPQSYPGKKVGWMHDQGYCCLTINNKKYKLHILAWFYMTGVWPKVDIDHIDNNRSNNKWLNLREATPSQNGANSLLNTNNTSGYKGVSWNKIRQKYEVYIKIGYTKKHLGLYKTLEKSSAVYDEAALKYFGEFALTNAMLKERQIG